MSYCYNCGTQITEADNGRCPRCGRPNEDRQYFCSTCGASLLADGSCPNCSGQKQVVQAEEDGSMIGWGFLGFWIPMVGVILSLIWRQEYPRRSKALMIGALITIAFAILCFVLLFVMFGVLFKMGEPDLRDQIQMVVYAAPCLYSGR